MATNNDPTQQQRYAMRERTGSRPKEVYRPDQDVPGPNHGTGDALMCSGEPSTLSSIRSDSENLDERMRDGLVRADALDQSTFYHKSSMLNDRSAGLNQDNTEHQYRPQYPVRSWASRDANTENRGRADYLQFHHNPDPKDLGQRRTGRIISRHQTQQRRSASPRPIDETSFRSRSPLHPTTRPAVRTAREIEQEKAMVDKEAAVFEAEYHQLLLEESVQKRDHFKAMVEEQKRKMARYSTTIKDASVQESDRDSSTVVDDGATSHPGRPANLDWVPTTIPARSEVKDALKDFNPPTGPRGSLIGSMGNRSAPSAPRTHMVRPSPELTIKGTADAAIAPTPPLPAPPREKGLNNFGRRVLATLAKGYDPRTGTVPAPPRTLRYEEAKDLGRVRLYTENYGGTRNEDLALCKWVFDTEKECINGKECPCRHEPLDEEELEWIRTNPVPLQRKIAYHPGRWLERLLQNYSNPRMPKVSRFDRDHA